VDWPNGLTLTNDQVLEMYRSLQKVTAENDKTCYMFCLLKRLVAAYRHNIWLINEGEHFK